MPRRLLAFLAIGLLLLASCVTPAPPRQVPLGLEPPVQSPPGELSLQERVRWWENQLPRLSSSDRVEARLLMGELHLEAGQADAARLAFYEAKGGHLSATELARSERGIGLSYFLQGNLAAGVSHLERALPQLEGPAAAETEYLLAAAKGSPLNGPSNAVSERMGVYLAKANLKAPVAKRVEASTDGIHFDVSRQQWNAAAMHSNWDRMTTPYRITVHHTAIPISSTSLSGNIAAVRVVQGEHMNGRGMADIAYHFLIGRDGRIFQGRPLYAQGAHASGDYNIGNIGICLLGNFVAQPNRGPEYAAAQAPTAKQMESLERLVGEVRSTYGIKANQVWGHQHWKPTKCPGPHLLSWAARYRRSVQ
ncbi:MAG: peptidoglycan recognition family protein [Planctomycetota bacterium]